VGSTRQVPINVRILAATNRNLEQGVAQGSFRRDLYFRLNEFVIHVPPLRQRREDIPYLAKHFMDVTNVELSKQVKGIARCALEAMLAYDWPGNVRQLRNLMDWLLIMAPGGAADPIRAEMLPPEIGANAPALLNIDPTADIMGLPLREARDLFETQYLQAQLLRFGGNISRTAQFVGMERSALHRKLKQLGVNSDERVGG
jgi:two-component system nitrogen regulation response regulator NtrX